MRERLINMHKNLFQLKRLPYCKIVSQKRNSFSAELDIRDGKYKIRIDYYKKGFPNVYVVNPEIDMSESLEIHTFGNYYHGAYKKELPKLCLTHLETDKWDSSILLTESYIPWAIEWTEFYELWLLTGKWYGGGVHPTKGEVKEHA